MRIVVIGAGIVGACVADALARRGCDVTVLDMRSPGRGATQASAGVLAPFIEADERSPLFRLAVRGLDRYESFIAELRERAGTAIEYARTGTLEVALTTEEFDHLEVAKRVLDAHRVDSTWLDGTSLRAFEPTTSPSAIAGLHTHAHGFVGVASMIKALVESARLAGASFEQPVEAVRIDETSTTVTVTAGDRSYAADWVVIAAGSWTNRIRVSGATLPPVTPIRGQLLHLGWNGTLPLRSVWGTQCYTVPWSDGTLLLGATVEDVGFDERSTVAGVHQLTTAIRRLLPASEGATVESIRVGLRPATPDGVPYIGPLGAAPRVVMATGHYRNGVLLAPLTADLVSALIVDGSTDPMLEATSPNRAGAGPARHT